MSRGVLGCETCRLGVGSGIGYPAGFSGDWSGAIPSGGSTNLTVTFSPSAATNYSGSLTVGSDATGGANTLSVSGVGVLPMPPAQKILAVSVNADGLVTFTYAVSPGFPYRIETATNLCPPAWTTVAGSATNPAVDTVTFTDPNPPGGGQRYYRTSSPLLPPLREAEGRGEEAPDFEFLDPSGFRVAVTA